MSKNIFELVPALQTIAVDAIDVLADLIADVDAMLQRPDPSGYATELAAEMPGYMEDLQILRHLLKAATGADEPIEMDCG